MGSHRRFLACGLILGVFSLPLILPLVSAKAETTAHRIKRKLHKMERRTGMAFTHMGLYLAEEIFPPLADADDPEEAEDDGDLFNVFFSFSFHEGRARSESGHQPQPQAAKPPSSNHPAKKK